MSFSTGLSSRRTSEKITDMHRNKKQWVTSLDSVHCPIVTTPFPPLRYLYTLHCNIVDISGAQATPSKTSLVTSSSSSIVSNGGCQTASPRPCYISPNNMESQNDSTDKMVPRHESTYKIEPRNDSAYKVESRNDSAYKMVPQNDSTYKMESQRSPIVGVRDYSFGFVSYRNQGMLCTYWGNESATSAR